jgi:hypothetical protein
MAQYIFTNHIYEPSLEMLAVEECYFNNIPPINTGPRGDMMQEYYELIGYRNIQRNYAALFTKDCYLLQHNSLNFIKGFIDLYPLVSTSIQNWAVIYDRVDVLIYIVERPVSNETNANINELTTYTAASNNSIKCLEYLYSINCPWNTESCSAASSKGYLECLTFLHNSGCLWDHETCSRAAANGHLNCLKYARENECEWNVDTCNLSAFYGHLNCLIYAHENNCQWNDETMMNACYNNSHECLLYMLNNGCDISDQICEISAINGSYECLVIAYQHRLFWDENTCSGASINGHLDCLQYAHENGCIWDVDTIFNSVSGGHMNCLVYACVNNCPYNTICQDWNLFIIQIHQESIMNNNVEECIIYLRHRCFPEILSNSSNAGSNNAQDLNTNSNSQVDHPIHYAEHEIQINAPLVVGPVELPVLNNPNNVNEPNDEPNIVQNRRRLRPDALCPGCIIGGDKKKDTSNLVTNILLCIIIISSTFYQI